MSYYHNKKINDVFIINNVIYPSQKDVYYLGSDVFIEIFNNEVMEFDLTDVMYKCSNLNVTGVELNKIKVDWGDGNIDVVTKGLRDKGNSINNKGQSWKKISHLYNTDKRNIYLTDDINSLSRIEISLYNTYNDVTKLVFPFKLIYKTIYDMDCNFNIMSANVTNNNLTSYVLKESNTDAVTIVQSRDWKQQNLVNEDIVYVTNNSISTDYSNEFVNEDAIVWDWNSIPYIDIVPTVGSYNGYRAITTTFTERTVPVESWTPFAYRLADTGDVKISNITKPQYTSNTFVVRGGTSSAPADLSEGIYKIYVNLTGINDVTGNTDSIYKAVPESYNASEKVSFSSTPTAASNLNYQFTYKNTAQNKYIKSGKLILTPLKLDISPSMLGDLSDATSFATADPYYKFEYDLQFPTNLTKSDGVYSMVRSIPLKSLPNGIYTVAYEVEDILGNKISDNTNSSGAYMGNLSWNYTTIGEITCNAPVVESITNTTTTNGVTTTTWVNDIVKFTWSVTNPTELDKVTFSMIHNSDIIQGKDVIAETGDVFVNLRQSVDTTSTESISNVWQPTLISTESSNTYNFTHTIAPEKIPDGDYKIITSHAIEMLDYVSERVVDSEQTMTYTYNVPKCTISSINPVMKIDRAYNRWKPVFDVSVNFSKNKLGNCPVAPKVDVTDIKLNVLDESDSHIIKDKIVSKQSKYEYDFDDVNMKYSDKNKTLKFSYKCRDVIDTIWKRSEKNPTQYIISRNDTGFGAFISMLPKTPESIYNYNNYTRDSKTLSGVEVANESAVDIYRIYANADRTLFSSVASPCYFYKTSGETNTNLYTYFTTKVYTDENNPTKKFGRYVWSNTQTEQTLELLDYVSEYVPNKLNPDCTDEYDKSVDSSSIIMKINNQSIAVPDVTGGKFVQERVMCALLSFEKKDLSTGKYEEVIPPFDIRSNTLPIRVDDLELGTYHYKLKYSSVNTRNYQNLADTDTDSNTIYTSDDIILKAPYKDTITAQVAKVPFNDNLTSITFSWTLHHKKATNLKLHWCEYNTDGTEKKKDTVNLKNTATYHNPSHYFTNGNKVQFYFTFDSEDVEWGDNDDKIVPSDYASNNKHSFTV